MFLIFATQAKAQALEEIVTTVDHELLDCATFYDSLSNLSSIYANGGVITGAFTFVLGINEDAANFDGSSYITYNDTMFNSESGSVSLWFKKNSADTSSGIVQIGHLGQPNSLGLFYNYQDNLYFEIKDNNGYYEQAYEPDVLSESEFAHVVIVWDKRVDEHHIKLFVNGEYVGGDVLSGTFIHNQGYMDLGRTGWYGNSEGIIDEVRFFNWSLSDPEVYAEYVYSSNRFRNQPTKKPVSTGKVQVRGKSLYVNGELFKVKGVGYQPVPIGSSNTQATLNYVYTNPGIIERDVTLLRDMNVNVVRFWGELNDTVLLDALYNKGMKPIYAIMAFEVPWSGINYSDPSTIAALEDEFREYVQEFKDHPAVLAWAIGNENNLHYTGDVADWFVLANRLAKVAYEEEGASYHPTIVINGYMLFFGDIDYRSDDISMNYTDVWGHNSYTGYEFDCYFDYYDTISAKPLVVTEFGIDAYNTSSGNEYQEVQAEWAVHQWQQIVHNSAGGVLMEYCDEWWKAGYPSSHNTGGYYTDVQPDGYSNEEWWGIMRTEDNGSYPDVMEPRAVYYVLQSLWSSAPTVGGIIIPVDKFGLLGPYIGLASTILAATVATTIYAKRVKRRKEKQQAVLHPV